jgi:hypothetical protein
MTTTLTTYTKGGLGCCLTFTRDGQAFAIHGRGYHDVDKIDFVGEPVKTSKVCMGMVTA